MQNIFFTYEAEKYPFFVEEKISSRSTGTYVYSGRFREEAPGNLLPGTRYCLKQYDVTESMLHERTPQNREYMDLISYEGEHLRRILLKDDNTRLLLSGSKTNQPLTCMIIEPLYQTIEPAVLTFGDKLEILLQTIAGLEELNTGKNGYIVAHRDLKLGNLMLERKGTSFCVKIIDFASSKAAEESPDSDGTDLNAMSFSNTPPEYILEMKPSAKADVFALGMLLAELFGLFRDENGETMNPMCCWFAKIPRGAIRKTYEALWEKYADDTAVPSWLERELAGKLTLSGEEFPEELVRVFRRCIACRPDGRISLMELKKVLINLQSMLSDVILLDLTGLAGNRAKYLKAMKEYSVFASENTRHMVYVYHDVNRNDADTRTNWSEVCSGMGRIGNAEDYLSEQDVSDGLRKELPAYPKGSCSGVTASLYKMIRDREKDPQDFRYFSGQIHIFASADMNAGKFLTVNGRPIRYYADLLGSQFRLIVYCDGDVRNDTGSRWYTECRPFHKVQSASRKPSEDVPEIGTIPVSVKNKKDALGRNMTPEKRRTQDIFFRSADGSIHYVVIHKE